MAVAFDAVASATGFTATTTTLTFAHTCGASANILVVAAVAGAQSGDGGASFSGVTYNGVAMTSFGAIVHTNAGTAGFIQGWYLLNPTTGSAQNVVITRSGGAGTIDLIGNAISYSGAGTPVGYTSATGNGGAGANSITAATTSMAVQFMANGAGFGAATFNRTQRFKDDVNLNSGAGNMAGQDMVGTGSSASLSITPATGDFWASLAFEIPAGGGGGGGASADGYTPLRPGFMAPRAFPAFMTPLWTPATPMDAPPTPISVAVDVATLTLTGVTPTPPVTFRFVAGVSGTGRYFVDQVGDPIAVIEEHSWHLIARAGAHDELGVGTTTPQGVFAAYASTIAANGFNAVEVLDISTSVGGQPGPFADGRTWDGVTPWVGGAIGVLNSSYWSRVDDFIDAMAAQGITVILNLISSYTAQSGAAFSGVNTTNGATFGTAIGNRYKSKPNLIYQFGVDDFGFVDSVYQAVADAIQATGDTHLITEQNMAESNSRTESGNTTVGTFGPATDVAYDEVYTYNAPYVELERDYALTSPSVRPTLLANGFYDQATGSSTSGYHHYADILGWALTCGSKGVYYGSESTWQWDSGAYAALSVLAFPNGPLPTTFAWFTALTNWQNLVPDFDSSFLNGSRGTKLTALTSGGGGGSYTPQNDYLTGAITADGKLALIYTPTSRTVTFNGAEMVASYTAKWVDPYTGAITTAASSATSYAHPGNNSNGEANWYLLLQEQTAISQAVDTATLTLTGVDPGGAGSGSSSTTVDVAALTLTGVDPTGAGTGASSTAVDVATLTLTGQTPGAAGTGAASQGVDVAALTLTGVDPAATGTGASSNAVDPAVLTLTGVDVSVTGGPVSVAVDFATLTLSGVDPTGAGSGAASQPADVAVLTLTGVDPTGSGTGSAAQLVDVSILTLTGVDVTGSTGTVGTGATIDVASLTLVGVDPTAAGTGAAAVVADFATLTLTGVTPVGAGSGVSAVLVDTAVLTLTGVNVLGTPFVPDPNPITATYRATGHTTTSRTLNARATVRVADTSSTVQENRNP